MAASIGIGLMGMESQFHWVEDRSKSLFLVLEESLPDAGLMVDRTFSQADSIDQVTIREPAAHKVHMNSNEPIPNTDQIAIIAEPPRKSPWSTKAKLMRLGWGMAEFLLWKPSPISFWGYRRALLRIFGARIGKDVRVHPSVKVIIPWNIELGDGVVVHERAILYALGQIRVGQNTEIGPLAHICAGTHDFTDPAFTLLRQPITIGQDCLIGIAGFVAPNVVLADRTILEPRCAIYMNSDPGTTYIGNPAKPVTPSHPSTLGSTQAVAS